MNVKLNTIDENSRVNALRKYRIADILPEDALDNFAVLAARMFNMPAAIIAFLDEQYIYYKASTGIGSLRKEKRNGTVCNETIEATGDEVHIVDWSKGLFKSPAVIAHSVFEFYAALPIITPDGYAIGCICLLDHRSHHFTAEQIATMKALRTAIIENIDQRMFNLQEKERHEWFIQTSEEGFWEWDINHDKISWNTGFSKLYNYPAANIVNYNFHQWCCRFSGVNAREMRDRVEDVNFRDDIWEGEYLFKKADDTHANVYIKSSVIIDGSGKPVKIIGFIRDLNENLKQGDKTHQELLYNKDEYISIVSHEIKTPITIIRSYSQIIKREIDKNFLQNTNLHLYSTTIQRQCDKLQKLVSNFLDISRINSGKMAHNPESFYLITLLEQIIDELDLYNDNHIIQIKGNKSTRVHADKFRIGQVLTNLISNAVKYSPGAEKIVISFYKKKNSNLVKISIRDFGRGIAREDQEKLFEKFQRIITLQESYVSGTGLGLSIAMEIVKQHGSTISIKSDTGQGSVFSFELPIIGIE